MPKIDTLECKSLFGSWSPNFEKKSEGLYGFPILSIRIKPMLVQ